MVDIKTEKLDAFVSAQVSAIDGIQYDTVLPAQSAFLGTFAEALQRLQTRVDSPSAALVSGGSTGSVALALPSTLGASAIVGRYQGWPFILTGVGISGQPTSLVSTGSTTVRKVLVTLKLDDLPVQSSIDATNVTVQFVYGSAFATSAGAVNSGGVSSVFNKVPLPKASGGEIPVGWLNVPNSFAVSAGIADHMMLVDYRETQGYDFSAIIGNAVQP